MEPIHVVCCPDNNYAMPTGVMLCSLCENNKDASLFIHVIYLKLSENNRNLLKKTVEKYHQTIAFYEIEESALPSIQTFSDHQKLPISAFLRLFVGSILPNDVHRVLYLDGDIIVRKSIDELYNTEFMDTGVAVVLDCKMNGSDISRTFNALKYPPYLGYFNSGVLLVNLDYWRNKKIETLFIETIKDYMRVLYHSDQEVLNKVFCNSKVLLPFTFNFQHGFRFKPEYRMISWEYNKEIEETYREPVILHFTGSKPWNASCDDPYQQEFHKYKALTPWKDLPIKGKIAWEIRKRLKRMCMWLKIPYNYYHVEWAYSYSDLKK